MIVSLSHAGKFIDDHVIDKPPQSYHSSMDRNFRSHKTDIVIGIVDTLVTRLQ